MNSIMKYSFTLFLLISGIIQYSQAQHSSTEMVPILLDSLAIKYARTINESDLRNYLSILSSDALEGRETGSRGQKMAAAFIRVCFY
jgi:hypothetical protein